MIEAPELLERIVAAISVATIGVVVLEMLFGGRKRRDASPRGQEKPETDRAPDATHAQPRGSGDALPPGATPVHTVEVGRG